MKKEGVYFALILGLFLFTIFFSFNRQMFSFFDPGSVQIDLNVGLLFILIGGFLLVFAGIFLIVAAIKKY
jgi:hypothetical protein